MLWKQRTLNCGGNLLDLSDPVVMGILNITPDSFFSGSRFDLRAAKSEAARMIKDGAKIIDIGGMSTRPGAGMISARQEIKRVIPVVETIRALDPDIVISIDTFRAEVAYQALHCGANMVNDISASRIDPELIEVVIKAQVPYVLMHMQGTPDNMQNNPYYKDVLIEVLDFLIHKSMEFTKRGLHDIIIDPGFGFGKRIQDNLTLLRNLHVFKIAERPILVGLSRKSTIQKLLDVSSEEALNGTSALHMIALEQGAQILRVHDVRPAMECILLWKALRNLARSDVGVK